MTTRPVAAVILAAGASQRLGRPKALVRLPSGKTLLQHAVGIAIGVGLEPAVTVRDHDRILAHAIATAGARPLPVAEASEGMAASVRAAAAFAAHEADALLILLVDQWRLTSQDLSRLLERRGPDRVIAAEYAGRPGVPALFPKRFYADLATLSGDSGARNLLRSGALPVESVEMSHARCDLDTPESLADLRSFDPLPQSNLDRAEPTDRPP